MSKSFELIEGKFSEVDKEKQWTYEFKDYLQLPVNKKSHYYRPLSNLIANQLILE